MNVKRGQNKIQIKWRRDKKGFYLQLSSFISSSTSMWIQQWWLFFKVFYQEWLRFVLLLWWFRTRCWWKNMQFYYNQYLASDNNINFNNNSDYNVNDYCWIYYLYRCYDSVSSYLIFLIKYLWNFNFENDYDNFVKGEEESWNHQASTRICMNVINLQIRLQEIYILLL